MSVTLPPILVLTNLVPVLLAPAILEPSSGGSALGISLGASGILQEGGRWDSKESSCNKEHGFFWKCHLSISCMDVPLWPLILAQ